MAKLDPEKETQRLADLYASLSDEELQKIGIDSSALTDWARQALSLEMKRRGLDAALPAKLKDSDDPNDPGNRPVVLRRYRHMPQAFVEKSVLEDAGIDCFLQDDNVVRMDWLWSNAMGGIKLIVRQRDAQEAETILSQKPPQE